MAHPSDDVSEVTARILYWGIAGVGKTTSLQTIHAKLREDHRGAIAHVPTRLDPSIHYEQLPIELGSINGVRTQLRITAVPGAPEQAHTRKQLLDEVDGIVLVLDARADRMDENLASLAELRASLDAYGRALEDLPTVVQFNMRDHGDAFTIEELHRRIALPEAAVFETVATTGAGILQCLTTISKRVVRVLRERPPPAIGKPGAVYEPKAEHEGVATPPVAEVTQPIAQPVPRPAANAESPIADFEAPVAEPLIEEAPTLEPMAPSPSLMEAAILAEGEDLAEASLVDEAAFDAQSALDQPWEAVAADALKPSGARIGGDLRIVSVGTASREGDRSVRVPLVLGNAEGESVTVALSISIDPLLDETPS